MGTFLLVTFLSLSLVSNASDSDESTEQFLKERINLALRNATDKMLDIAGDSVSAIYPVQHNAPGKYSIRIDKNFNYDTLPTILQETFMVHGITSDYLVSVEDCTSGEIVLGYRQQDLATTIPCVGRDLPNRCLVLNVMFPDTKLGSENTSLWYLLALAGSFLIGFIVYQKTKINGSEDLPLPEEKHDLSFGHTRYDALNQRLTVLGEEKSLTFRESKLLKYFLEHKNQLLERDQILSAVWEDEGIMVGRSLDVFVSRLRKLLKADPSVKISNVHGVGYRFEVAE